MAITNFVYPKYKTAILTAAANVSLVTEVPTVALLENTFAYDPANSLFSDLAGIAGTPQAIGTPAVSATTGVFSGANVTFAAVVPGTEIKSIVMYLDTGVKRLVFIEDGDDQTAPVTGLPVTPNGGDISISWSGSGILLI